MIAEFKLISTIFYVPEACKILMKEHEKKLIEEKQSQIEQGKITRKITRKMLEHLIENAEKNKEQEIIPWNKPQAPISWISDKSSGSPLFATPPGHTPIDGIFSRTIIPQETLTIKPVILDNTQQYWT